MPEWRQLELMSQRNGPPGRVRKQLPHPVKPEQPIRSLAID
jgi:hypothetical protein